MLGTRSNNKTARAARMRRILFPALLAWLYCVGAQAAEPSVNVGYYEFRPIPGPTTTASRAAPSSPHWTVCCAMLATAATTVRATRRALYAALRRRSDAIRMGAGGSTELAGHTAKSGMPWRVQPGAVSPGYPPPRIP